MREERKRDPFPREGISLSFFSQPMCALFSLYSFSKRAIGFPIPWEKALSISISISSLSLREFFRRASKRQFDIMIFCSIAPIADPLNFLQRLESKDLPKNFSGWENKKFQNLLKSYRTSKEPSKKGEIIKMAEEILLEEAPVAPLYSYYFSSIQKTFLKNASLSHVGTPQFDQVTIN